MAYTIEVEGLRKSFGDRPVLAGIELQVAPGTVAALLGPNGAGKTTTVKILSTLLRPDAGRVVVAGVDVVGAPAEVRRRISLTGQHATVDEVLTGRENLVMMGRLRHLTKAVARERAQALLERFDLVEAADRRVSTYSGGMARRLDIALGLVDDPVVLFLDEPTTGLDPRSRRDVRDTVAELAASGVTVLLTTQYLEEADRLADTISVLADGRIAAAGTADQLKALIGGETVELVLPDEAALAAASALLVGGRVDGLSLHVRTDGTAAGVREVLEVVAGVPVLRVAVHRPTLDDVFLQVTA
ncbi:ATP-binding cassette domain-containing protein [Pseudonocardia sp. WMMC193]|uniref:ATP-binding cassette domain-containing protein n=1 Tax=Pseudonocardia sp. WMMC193 TaxID=2911965 RepID=UPI001F026DAD|nr:ATP-binding cassette domain-containing protein [Pseudonocardia sp. WMMC193]MCF7550036.1 ATP-binding cassette domain-containing protein [Pseudonocardia sp. WMMC193]